MLSDIENIDIMLGENHFNDMRRDESLDGTSIRRQESVTSNNLENEEMNLHSDHRNPETGTSAGYDRITASIDSQAEINKLSSELNSRISREMDEMMNSVSSQIQRAISDAINNQVLPQIRNVIMAGSGQETRRGWEKSDERPESYSEVQYNAKTRSTLNNEHGDKAQRNVHDGSTDGGYILHLPHNLLKNKTKGNIFNIVFRNLKNNHKKAPQIESFTKIRAERKAIPRHQQRKKWDVNQLKTY